MTREKGGKGGLVYELGRRRVLPVAAAYAVGAWALVETSSLLLETFEAPDLVMRVIIIIAVAGFPLAVMLAWVFDISTQGITRTGSDPDNFTNEVAAKHSPPGRKLKQINVALLSCLPIRDATSLDPEDLLDLRSDIAEKFADTSREFGGVPFVDTSLEFQAIFGYPKKGDDDLQRAVDCGLSLASGLFRTPPGRAQDDRRSPRVGLHVGPILVPKRRAKGNEMPPDTMLGTTGRLAARMAHAAPPGKVLVSSAVVDSLGDKSESLRLEPLAEEAEHGVTGAFLLGAPSV